MNSFSYFRAFTPIEIYRLGAAVGSGELKTKIEKHLGRVHSIDMEEAPNQNTELIIKFLEPISVPKRFFNQEMDSVLDAVGVFNNQPEYA
jgi:hypothetical protein